LLFSPAPSVITGLVDCTCVLPPDPEGRERAVAEMWEGLRELCAAEQHTDTDVYFGLLPEEADPGEEEEVGDIWSRSGAAELFVFVLNCFFPIRISL